MKTKKPIGKKKAVPKGRGRPPIYRNDRERDQAERLKNREYQTSDDYKERRRQRYAEDAEYREACQQRAREYSMSKRSPGAHEAYKDAVMESLSGRKSLGTVREISTPKGKVLGTDLSYSIPECALVINRPAYVVREWINSGRFPAPALVGKGERGGSIGIYTDAQVVGFAKAAILHLRIASAHLNANRTEAIVAFRRAMQL